MSKQLPFTRHAIRLFAAFFALMLSSCATIINDDCPKVVIEGEIDEPVTIITEAQVYKDVTLPIEVSVKRHGIEGQHIRIQSDNHEYDDIVLHKKQSWWTLGNLVAWGVPGFLVDWGTNSNKNPRHNHYLISPKGGRETLRSTEPFNTDIPVNRPDANPFYRHELNFSAGSGSALEGVFDDDVDRHVHSYGFDEPCPWSDIDADLGMSLSLDYMYNINRRLAVGIAMGWAVTSADKYKTDVMEIKDEDGTTIPILNVYETHARSTGYYVMPSVRYKWWIMSKAPLAFYSQLSLGYAHTKFDVEGVSDLSGTILLPDITTTHNRLGYQVTFVGLEIGRGHLRSLVEGGMGYKGYLNIGLKYCF